MSEKGIGDIEKRLERVKKGWKLAVKYGDILSGKIKYTAADIDELLEYLSSKEKYEACQRLIKLKDAIRAGN